MPIFRRKNDGSKAAEGRGLVILGFILKKNDGPTLVGVKERMRRRLRKYLNGDYGFLDAGL